MISRRFPARRRIWPFLTGLVLVLAGIAYAYWTQTIVLFPAQQGIGGGSTTGDPIPEEVIIQPEILHPDLLPAFPGAGGAGAATPGGRGGRVIEVTNLNDSGPGSLREAIDTPGPRIVVFRVGGVIELQRPLIITDPYITIAGQTAPGGGITLSGVNNQDGEMIILRNVHDVVIRYLRIRHGQLGEPGRGQINIAIDSGTHNVVIDHVSLSWTLDENLMIHRNIPDGEDADSWPEITGISIQRSLLAEGLHPHSTGIQLGGEVSVEGWYGVHDISIHQNLFVHNSHRNPGIGSLKTQVINNVIYNWSPRAGETWRDIDVDWISNVFKPGPMSTTQRLLVHVAFPVNEPFNPWPAPSLYVNGNIAPPRFPDPGMDNWPMYLIHYLGIPLPENFRRYEPLPFTAVPVEILSAGDAYISVLGDVGANARLGCDGSWIPNQDAVDQRLIRDVREGTGPESRPISDPAEVGGLPEIDPGVACPDADHDGMPDEWEMVHPPLDPAKNDASGYDLHPDYTNIEVYLNGE